MQATIRLRGEIPSNKSTPWLLRATLGQHQNGCSARLGDTCTLTRNPGESRSSGELAKMNLKNLPTVRPVAGPLLLFLAFGMVNILGVKPFQALNEPRHAAYAVVLATGHIPNIREPIPYEVLHTGRIRGTNAMVAAVHPPLYYSVVALPLKLGSLPGQMD